MNSMLKRSQESLGSSQASGIARDALSSEGKTPQQRIAMFADLMDAVEQITASLSAEERLRRSVIALKLDPRPEPWWRNFRAEALAEFKCPN